MYSFVTLCNRWYDESHSSRWASVEYVWDWNRSRGNLHAIKTFLGGYIWLTGSPLRSPCPKCRYLISETSDHLSSRSCTWNIRVHCVISQSGGGGTSCTAGQIIQEWRSWNKGRVSLDLGRPNNYTWKRVRVFFKENWAMLMLPTKSLKITIMPVYIPDILPRVFCIPMVISSYMWFTLVSRGSNIERWVLSISPPIVYHNSRSQSH